MSEGVKPWFVNRDAFPFAKPGFIMYNSSKDAKLPESFEKEEF
jgi:hypothetical protein